MFDQVTIFLPEVHVLPARAVPTWDTNGAGGAPLRAELAGLDLKLGTNGLLVKGSLTRFLRGENVGEFTLRMTRDALTKLEDAIGSPIGCGQVWSLEVARTIIMRKPPAHYLTLWGDVPRFMKTTHPNGLTVCFHNGRRSFQGYDKSAQVGPENLPELYKGRNLLRLEAKYKKGLAEILGHPLTVAGLTDPSQYVHFLQGWKRFALSIPMARKSRPVFDCGMTSMRESLAAVGLEALGGPSGLLADLAGRMDLSKVQRSKMKAQLLALSNGAEWTDPNELTLELGEKVRDAVRCFR